MLRLRKLILMTSVGAMAAVAVTGCQMNRASGDRTAGRMLDDKMITEHVEERLQNEPVYKFSDVDVKTFAGVVQLSGFVNTQEQKQRAGNIAQNVEGVARVVNSIALKPDTQLAPTGVSGGTNDVNRLQEERMDQQRQQQQPIQSQTQ